MLTLRPYQQAAISSIYGYFQTDKGNPLVVIPTAGGKSLVMAAFMGMSLAVLKFARQALLVDDAMRRPPAVQGRG